MGLHGIAGDEADHSGRRDGDNDGPRQAPVGRIDVRTKPRKTQHAAQGGRSPRQAAPKQPGDSQDRAPLDNHRVAVEGLERPGGAPEAEQTLDDNQVACGTDREELGNPLDGAEHDGLGSMEHGPRRGPRDREEDGHSGKEGKDADHRRTSGSTPPAAGGGGPRRGWRGQLRAGRERHGNIFGVPSLSPGDPPSAGHSARSTKRDIRSDVS